VTIALGSSGSAGKVMPPQAIKIAREGIMRTAAERDVMFLDILVGNEPSHVPGRPMRQIVEVLDQLRRAEASAKWYDKNKRKAFIRDLELFADKACILLYYTNADAPGASFADLDTDEQRDENKKEREGRPESSHLVVNLVSQPDQATRYLAILEESSQLTRSLVQRYLTALLKEAATRWKSEFSVQHIDGSRGKDGSLKTQSFYPKLDLQGHLSADFKADLQAGILRGISLETSSADKLAFGETRSVVPRRHDVKLTPLGPWRLNPLEKITDALRMGRDNKYETARVVFVTQDGTSHVAFLDTDSGNVVNDGYIKRCRLCDFDHFLSEASTSIDGQMRDEAYAFASGTVNIL
jgi:hypothetical protein